MNTSSKVQNAEYLLKTLLFDPSKSEQLGIYDWASEVGRWNEFAAILMSRVCDLPVEEVRQITQYLSDLGHMDIAYLAEIPIKAGIIDRKDKEVRKMLDVFLRKDVSEEEALNILLPLCQMARGLRSHFNGKIQHYLRRYGEIMLKEIPQFFEIKGIAEEDINYIFSSWFQNVLNMPIPLWDDSVREFCESSGISEEDLWAATDNIDLNIAIVDDLVRLEMEGATG